MSLPKFKSKSNSISSLCSLPIELQEIILCDSVDKHNVLFVYQQIGKNLKYCKNINWTQISENKNLPEKFLKDFKNFLDWDIVTKHSILSENFIKNNQGVLKKHWDNISFYQKLSEKFIIKNKNLVHWKYISSGQKLSDDFMEKYIEELDVENLLLFQKPGKRVKNKLCILFILEKEPRIGEKRLQKLFNISKKLKGFQFVDWWRRKSNRTIN